MHTASVLLDAFQSHCSERVLKGGDVKVSLSTAVKAKIAVDALFDFYQAMGAEVI